MKRLLTWLLVVGALLPAAAQQITEQDKERAAALVERMTLDEKLDYIGGFNSFYIRAIPRLGIPQIRMADGPQGVRNDTRSTMFPCGIAAAAAWDRALVRDYGRALGQDCRARGVHILLGPGVNIYRSPLCGRNFEYYGEDPYLAAETAAAYIEGMQAEGVMACVKHFGGNNQEWNRHHVSSDIDERTLHEIYLPAFRKAVTGAKVGAVMSSYNPLNCVHMTENRPLTVGLLREKWGFDGIFMSDWNATYSAVGAANGGLDLEMPRARFMNAENLRPALKNGLVTEATVDEKCRHILQTLIAFGFLDREQTDAKIKERNPFSDQVALEVARGGIVLLKNEGDVLPLKGVRRIAVVGPIAKSRYHLLGSWSSKGDAEDVVSVFAGLEAEYGDKAELLYAQGCNFDGEDASGFGEAVAAASAADVVVLCLGEKRDWSGENASRSSIALPEIQERLARELAKTGKPIVLVLSSGRPLELCRLEPLSAAIVQMWQPGLRGGGPLAGILAGRINPSGRLAMTFPYSTGQIPIYYNHRQSARTHQGKYQDIPSTPLYGFGHGLSYTTFEYGDLKPSAVTFRRGDKVTVEIAVTNTGKMDGAETVHWFVSDPVCTISRPVRELKHFEKQPIRCGETHLFRFEIDPERDLSFTDGDGRRFLETGDYYVIVKDRKVKLTLTE